MKIKDSGKVPTLTNFAETKDGGELNSCSHRITTVEQLLAYSKVDENLWEVIDFRISKSEVGSKWREQDLTWVDNKMEGFAKRQNTFLVEPLFHIKVRLKRRKKIKESRAIIDDMIKDAKKHAPSYKKIVYPKSKEKYCLEISPADLHFGKLSWAAETGEDYDMKIARKLFNDAIGALCARAAGFPLEKILFVVGNDLLNVDNNTSMTTNGTPQDEDSRWQKSFIEVRKMLIEAIDRLQVIAPVDVIMVSGNHDQQRVFYVGDVLQAWYHDCPNVTIDNTPTLRKYFRYGQVFLGFTHGDKENTKNLPLIMATERPADWGVTKYREIHCGHFHKKKEIEFTSVDEFNGVRVRFLPSLSAADAWHVGKGYRAHRAAEAYVWCKNRGYMGHFSYSPV